MFLFHTIGNIYTGLNDGRIIRITKEGKMQEITRTGNNIPTCGKTKVLGFMLSLNID